ncbi:MAG: hypothetical protein H6709_04940 [Kofleriaceae bacterium]|nr:hypothetical protein [Kofleriaceae bacterium]MCB9571417.1 hypothetical protein [Kofleriaceae bacterium]
MIAATRRAALVAAAALAASALGGCGGCSDPGEDGDGGVDAAPVTYADCDSDVDAWVRNAYLAIVGHRPHGQAEVDVYVAIYDQIAALVEAGETTADPREVVARAMADEPGYRDRWTSHFLDALRVARLDEQNMASCYDDREQASVSPTLATYVRDNAATAAGVGRFTLRDLVESSLELDDVTPIYRAHPFALVNFPIPAANVPPVEAELARREDFGAVFDSAYLNRDLVCMQCHNSEFSVTDNPDPAIDRHWPMAGLFEKSLYGASDGIDHARAHAMFRVDGLVGGPFGDGSRRPWGWSDACGVFAGSVGDDPAAVDGKFGDLTGRRLTVYDLDAMLRTGFDDLRDGALAPGADGTMPPPDAFAYLTAATIVEGVWKEVVGTGLTIANYFPRNQAMRDTLQGLTDRFVASGYSLRDLLVAIVSSDFFSRRLPEDGCGATPYLYPNIYDPWVISDGDEAKRHNGPGDAIAAISARTLMRTAYEALSWPVPEAIDFPAGSDGGFCAGLTCGQLNQACNQGFCCDTYQSQCVGGGTDDELAFQTGVGAFMKNGERGFRGLDFQARLVWEDRFGACTPPAGVTGDAVDDIVAAAAAAPTSTVEDAIVALKDRLIGEPFVDDGGSPSERATLATVFGGALDRPASDVTDLEARLRVLCGALLSSPQFLLSGAAGRGGEVPALTPPAWRFDAVCADVGPRLADGDAGLTVSCGGDGTLTVAAPATGP